MEEQLLQLLQATTTPNTEIVRSAEEGLFSLYPQQDFPFALLTIVTHTNVDSSTRQSALTTLKRYVNETWSPQLDDFRGAVYLAEDAKSRVKDLVLTICTNPDATNDITIQALAASVVSRIAAADFPDNWSSLFPELLNTLNNGKDDVIAHAVLRVLLELVDALNEGPFFTIAGDLVNALQNAATTKRYGPAVQALAVNVLGSCLETLEQITGTQHGPAIRAFLDDSLKQWIIFFMQTLREPLPEVTPEDYATCQVLGKWRGPLTLKIQVVKILDSVKRVHVSALTPHVLELFSIIWDELFRLAPGYAQLFIDGDSGESGSFDSDNLGYTLDSLISAEIDFIASAMKAKSVRNELQKQMQQLPNVEHTVGWLQELIKVLVLYARIPLEEEGFWEADANLYISEQTSITANYTPRAAAADLVVRTLMEWLRQLTVKAMLHFYDTSLVANNASWKEREGLLFLLNQAVKDLDDAQAQLESPTTTAMLNQIAPIVQDPVLFMRAAAHLCLGTLFKVASGEFSETAATYMSVAVRAATEDASDVVHVCCITTIPQYIEALPHEVSMTMRAGIINTIQEFLNNHDLREDMEDAADVKSALITTLRDAILLDVSNLSDGPGIDLFFTLASDGAASFQLAEMLVDSFQNIVEAITERPNAQEAYVRLCAKTIPSLSGAFDIANMTDESALTDLAAELVSSLAEFGFDPLPDGFIAAVMPKLQRVLMEGNEASLVRPATSAVSHMLNKGTVQMMSWTDPTGKPSVQVTLEIVDRLLNSPDVEESAADQVGYLASTVVTKYGADGLGEYLHQLLRAVAVRLATAQRPAFIQSLLMVFATLSVTHADSVVDFLSQIEVDNANGLTVVLTKWLENSVNFAGFDEIRTNVVALSKICSLQDARVKAITVKGDLIVEETTRIKTRSRAKANPDRYAMIPADLKILKLLVDECYNAATSKFSDLAAAQAAADALEDDSDLEDDNGDWEDVGDGGLNLSSESFKAEMLELAGENGPSPTGSRARDDETADYLLSWFRSQGQQSDFETIFNQLNADEQSKLRELLQ